MSGRTNIPRIQVFRPTLEEMKDFPKYIEHMESKGAHLAGLAKIIPPEEWKPRKNLDYLNDKNVLNLEIKEPIQQNFHGMKGMFYFACISLHYPGFVYNMTSLIFRSLPLAEHCKEGTKGQGVL